MCNETVLVGIDFGTTTTKVSIRENSFTSGNIKCIEFSPGKAFIPSTVSIHKKNRSLIVGMEDVASAYWKVAEPKRLIGRQFGTVENVDEFPSKLGYSVTNVDRLAYIKLDSSSETEESLVLDPRLVVADILKKVRNEILENLGLPYETDIEAVVTVPANYGYSQKSATMEAARLSGMKILHLIPEPTAAALTFLEKGRYDDGIYVVIDFGGGTLDLSVVKLKGKMVSVKKVFGNMSLGGGDIDTTIVNHFKTKIDQCLEIPLDDGHYNDIFQYNLSQLRKKAKHVKEELSLDKIDSDVVQFSLNLKASNNDLKNIQMSMSKKEFIDILDENFKELYIKELTKCKEAIENQIKGVFLAGGSSKLPTIEKWTKEVFGPLNIYRDSHQVQTLVARGALLAAESIVKGFNSTENLQVMSEVTSTYLGIETLDITTQNLNFSKLIDKFAPLPSELKKVFTTTKENQNTAKIKILESVSGTLSDAQELNNMEIAIKEDDLGKTKINITFKVDKNGVLQVNVEEGDKNHIIVVNLTRKWTEDEITEFQKRENFCLLQKNDENLIERIRLVNQLLENDSNVVVLDQIDSNP